MIFLPLELCAIAGVLYCLFHDCCCFQPVSVLVIQVCSDCCPAAWPSISKQKYIAEGLRLSCALLLIRCLRAPLSKISSAHLGCCWDFREVWLGKMHKVQTWFKKRNKNYPFCEPWHLASKPLTLYKDLCGFMNCLRALCASVGSFVWKFVICSVFNFLLFSRWVFCTGTWERGTSGCEVAIKFLTATRRKLRIKSLLLYLTCL